MKLIDMHCDTVSELLHRGEGQSLVHNHLCVDLERMQKAGTWIQFFACFVNAGKYERELQAGQELRKNADAAPCADWESVKDCTKISSEAWERAWKESMRLIERLRAEECDEIWVIKKLRELEEPMEQERKHRNPVAALTTVEEGGVLNGRIERLDELYKKGVRLITLTWNYENCIGHPNSRDAEAMKKGLKPFGMEVIERMNELGMLIDVSHLSDGGFWDCIQRSKAPIVASHSNARTLCGHPRNLSDEMLCVLAEKGGVAGLNFYPTFLKKGGQAGISDIARHAKYMIDTAGEDVAAIGTDFDGFEADIRDGYISHVGQMDLVWEACKKAGITERQLDKIRWQNAWRVMWDVLRP